jgi:hypothetical protein
LNLEASSSYSLNANHLEAKGSVSYDGRVQAKALVTLVDKSAAFIRVVGKALIYLPDPRRVRTKREREVMLRRVVSRHE